MPNFIAKYFIADFLSNFKASELEHKFEPGDLAPHLGSIPKSGILSS